MKPVIDRVEAVDDEIAASMRGMGPAKRLALVFQAERFARDLMRAGARIRHPEWNEAPVEIRIAGTLGVGVGFDEEVEVVFPGCATGAGGEGGLLHFGRGPVRKAKVTLPSFVI